MKGLWLWTGHRAWSPALALGRVHDFSGPQSPRGAGRGAVGKQLVSCVTWVVVKCRHCELLVGGSLTVGVVLQVLLTPCLGQPRWTRVGCIAAEGPLLCGPVALPSSVRLSTCWLKDSPRIVEQSDAVTCMGAAGWDQVAHRFQNCPNLLGPPKLLDSSLCLESGPLSSGCRDCCRLVSLVARPSAHTPFRQEKAPPFPHTSCPWAGGWGTPPGSGSPAAVSISGCPSRSLASRNSLTILTAPRGLHPCP